MPIHSLGLPCLVFPNAAVVCKACRLSQALQKTVKSLQGGVEGSNAHKRERQLWGAPEMNFPTSHFATGTQHQARVLGQKQGLGRHENTNWLIHRKSPRPLRPQTTQDCSWEADISSQALFLCLPPATLSN